MKSRRGFLGSLGLLSLLPACASPGAGSMSDARDPAGGAAADDVAFYDTRTGERLARRSLLRRTNRAPILLLGEVHDSTLHHRIRGSLLLDWVRDAPARPAAIVFEHLDRENDDTLRLVQRRQAYVRGKAPAGLTELLDAARFDRQAWGWPTHQPLFEAAHASGATWIAANFSRASAQRLGRDAEPGVDPVLRAMVESARWSDGAQQALAQALRQGHCNAISEAVVVHIAHIQRLRDAALALPLLDASERRSVLLAGNGHVRRDHGVPLYLGAFETEALVVGFEEAAGQASAAGLADRVGPAPAADFARAYDLLCLTGTVRRDDPCEAMKSAPAPAAPVDSPSAGAGRVNPAAPTRTPSR